MNYTEFKDYIMEHILENLPEKYADSQARMEQIIKNNDNVLDALQIIGNDSNMTPSIYLNHYFDDYEQGRSMENILNDIARIRMEHDVSENFDVLSVSDWEQIKGKISAKLINAEMNEQYLEDKPFTKLEDLAVTYHIMLGESEQGNMSIAVHNRLLESFGVDASELHQAALANMEQLTPVKFSNLQDVMKEMMIPDIMNDFQCSEEQANEIIGEMLPEEEMPMYCLTNESKLYGASAILNPDIREQIAEQLGGDFYVLPSSVHEVLIVPKLPGTDYQELENMVQEVNATQVLPEEILSDHVYEYDSATQELVRSDKAAERKEVREEAVDKGSEKKSLKEKLEEKKVAAATLGEGVKIGMEKKTEPALA